MTPETYFLGAILGLMLAGLVIKGWRRILPCLAFCLFLPELKAQSSIDTDDDVPTLTQIRDQIIAQKTMLDNYFSGYTAPNKLNDISNALYYQGTLSLGDYAREEYHNGVARNDKLNDIDTEAEAIKNNTAWLSNIKTNTDYNQYLGDVKNNTADISYLQSLTNSSLNSVSPSYGNQSAAEALERIRQALTVSGDPILSDISNYSEDSLTELQDISNSLESGGYSQALWSQLNNNTLNNISSSLKDPSLTAPWGQLNNNQLQDISNNVTSGLINPASVPYLSDTNSWLNGIFNTTTATNNSVGSLPSLLDTDNDVPAIQSLESLLSGYGQWDTDNDVDAIEAVEAAIDGLRNSNSANFATQHLDNLNIVAAITGLQTSLDEQGSTPSLPSLEEPELPDAPTRRPSKDFVTVNSENGNVTDKTIQDSIINDAGEIYLPNPIDLETNHTVNGQPSFFSSATNKRTPVAGSYTLPNVSGSGTTSITADIDAAMQVRMQQATPIVMPIFTGYLLFLIGRWTLDTSNHIIAS